MKKLSIAHIVSAYISILLCVYPLFFTIRGYAAMSDAKLYCFWALTICAFLCATIIGWRSECNISKIGRAVVNTESVVCLAVLLLVSLIISAACSNDPYMTINSERGVAWHFVYFVLFLSVGLFGRWHSAYVWAGTIAAVVNAVIMSVQLQGENPFGLYPQGLTYYDAHRLYSGEYLGTLGNSDIFGIWLFIITALCAGVLIIAEKCSQRVAGILGLFSAVYCGAASGTTGFIVAAVALAPILGFFLVSSIQKLTRWISVLVTGVSAYLTGSSLQNLSTNSFQGAMVFLPVLFLILGVSILCLSHCGEIGPGIYTKKEVKSRWFWLILTIGCVVMGCGIIYYVEPTEMAGMHYELYAILHGKVDSSFGSNRFLIWKECVSAIKKNPILGAGEPFTDVVHVTFQRTTEAGVVLATVVRDAHNILLSWLVHNGIVGTILVIALLGIVLYRGIRYGTERAHLCCAVLCGYLVIEMTALGGYFTDPIFWCFAGLVISESRKNA